ncbi:MAG: hypothetical protein HFACDABA_03058 [Anaerolineales bacterium]|nr:hypothetical protein [Anaerolineales bacterium]
MTATNEIKKFILKKRVRRGFSALTAISLFSGAGISDLGYELAGFQIVVQSEKDFDRANICEQNFPNSTCIKGDIEKTWKKIIRQYRKSEKQQRLSLLTVTPPCQGMSSSNPGRGKITDPEHGVRDERNLLLLSAIPIINQLKPRVVVAENVPALLNRVIREKNTGKIKTVVQAFADELIEYELFVGVVQMADYGIPQLRRRAILVAVHKDEKWLENLKKGKLLPWVRPTHSETAIDNRKKWVSVRSWLNQMRYSALDAKTKPSNPKDALHYVPSYDGDRYLMVLSIPPYSGKNAYQNSICPECNKNSIPLEVAYCPHCGNLLRNRPYVLRKNGRARLIKGFHSSYRRMPPDRPASTVTTNSSHIGGDYKIHPWENRVMSARECADLQTVPRTFKWNWAFENDHRYYIRNVIGEALPTYFAYLHGKILMQLLQGKFPEDSLSRFGVDGQDRKISKIHEQE